MNSRDSEHYKEYCKYRNQVRNLIKKARRNMEKDISREAKDNPKTFWNHVNNKTKTKPGIPNLQKSDKKDDITKNDKEKTEVLVDYFSSVFTNEPPGEIPHLDDIEIEDPLESITITEELVRKKLKALKANKSPGPDNIHPRILKELSDELAKPLSLLFIASAEQETIPDEWRTATVSAIFKKGNKKMANNYRPVSLTCLSCKLQM